MICRLLSTCYVLFLGLFSTAWLASTQVTLANEYVVKLKTPAIRNKGMLSTKELAKQHGRAFHIAKSSMEAATSTMNISITDQFQQANLILIDTKNQDPKSIADRLAQLAANGLVEYIVPNVKFHAIENFSDPRMSEQWALAKVNAEKAWDMEKGNSQVVVAVIDTGIDMKHEDLASRIWTNPGEKLDGRDTDGNGYVDDLHGWDFFDNNNNPMDQTSKQNPGHGTHCAGIIGAIRDNGRGVSGLANVTLMPIRFLGADGSGDLMQAAKAIRYAVDNGAHIISASWGASVSRANVKPILDEIEYAGTKGVIFVAAASNDGKNNDTVEVYPANAGFSNVISVAASDPSDGKPSWSNFGSTSVDLAAPGLNILSTVPGGYATLSGTSMATPLVAGLAALVLSAGKQKGQAPKPEEIKAILQASGTKVEIETACNCRIDAGKAVETVVSSGMTVVPNAGSLSLTESRSFHTYGGKAPFTFTSSNDQVASFDSAGTLVAKEKGSVVVTVTDATGQTAQSCEILVGKEKRQSSCTDPLCQAICEMWPDLPMCNE